MWKQFYIKPKLTYGWAQYHNDYNERIRRLSAIPSLPMYKRTVGGTCTVKEYGGGGSYIVSSVLENISLSFSC